MAFRSGLAVHSLIVLSMVALLASALTVTDDQGRQFEQREIVVSAGISQDDLNAEIQKAVREFYPSFRNNPGLVVKELTSFDDLNKNSKPWSGGYMHVESECEQLVCDVIVVW